jgi:hypothetical protein
MSHNDYRRQQNFWCAIEGVTFGLAYGAALCWGSVCLLASFRPNDMAAPYWSRFPLRSDTTGIIAFIGVAIFLTCSNFLRLRRRQSEADSPQSSPASDSIYIGILAAAQTIAFLATGLFIYLSVNAVTHPATLSVAATHLASWPTEGTLRVIALLLCVCSLSLLRFRQAMNGGAVRSWPAGELPELARETTATLRPARLR